MKTPPIILVPGFWLGAWAWDEVAGDLRAAGHDVTPITLPGLESADADRSSITFEDHVAAICAAVEAAGRPVVLAVHSASGYSGYAASDRIPERIAAMVYVDTAPGKPPLDPAFDGVEKPMVWADIEAEENLDGLTPAQIATFRERAVPVPGRVSVTGSTSATTPGGTSRARSSAPATPRSSTGPTRAHTPSGASSPASPSCATRPGSTCPRATGRCGRARPSSPRSSRASRLPAGRR